MPIQEFKERMDLLIRDIQAITRRSDSQPARVPGHAGYARKRRAQREGLPIPVSVYRKLADEAARRSIKTQLPPLSSSSTF